MTNKTFSEKVQLFYKKLDLPDNLPRGIEAINPYQHKQVKRGLELFLECETHVFYWAREKIRKYFLKSMLKH